MWNELKSIMAAQSGLSRDALHVLLAFSAHLALGLLLRQSLARPVPWMLVLVLALANEWHDLAYEIWPNRTVQWANSFRDMLTTMSVPTTLLIACRFLPALFRVGDTAPVTLAATSPDALEPTS